jgi:hypothetical protein
MRSFGGDLRYEVKSEGCCFAVVLPLQAAAKGTVNV